MGKLKTAPRHEHSLASISQLTPYRTKLGMLGYESLEQLESAAQVAGRELAAYLGVDIDGLFSSISVTANKLSPSELRIVESSSYPLGVALERIPPLEMAPAMFAAPPAAPATVNLIAQMQGIRDQGDRGTCVAFAALAAYEHALATAGAPHDLAEQFLYWSCKSNDGIPNTEGTWLGVAYPLVKRDGCCLEEKWPYVPRPIAGNVGQGPPPGGAAAQALSYRLRSFQQLAPTSVSDIKNRLAQSRCVSFSIPVFNSWYRSSQVAKTGNITLPIPGEVRAGGHAMCLVGYIDDDPTTVGTGGGRFILRNSWGQNWGFSSPYGAGYGTIPYSYITRFCSEAYSPD
jgi:C1A family cysteine protease